jgi:hypothetical protein
MKPVACRRQNSRTTDARIHDQSQAFEQLLTDCLRVLGPDHPHTLITRHNLAYWRRLADGS